jgi:hypothetical protein
LLLEKSKNPGFAAYASAPIPSTAPLGAIAPPMLLNEAHNRIADSSGLFRRLCVLLI